MQDKHQVAPERNQDKEQLRQPDLLSPDTAHAGSKPEGASAQQHTGNHPPERVPGGGDRLGGTRAGAENIEPGHTGSKPGKTKRVDEAAQRDSGRERAREKGYD